MPTRLTATAGQLCCETDRPQALSWQGHGSVKFSRKVLANSGRAGHRRRPGRHDLRGRGHHHRRLRQGARSWAVLH